MRSRFSAITYGVFFLLLINIFFMIEKRVDATIIKNNIKEMQQACKLLDFPSPTTSEPPPPQLPKEGSPYQKPVPFFQT